MSPLVIEIVLFIVGLVCLVKGGDWFVDGATGIAHKLHMPEILIGATVVSIGTTIPEVMVSSTAALTTGASAMAYGNAVGSIICNTALIAAITITIRPGKIKRREIMTPIIFFFVAAAFYVFTAYKTGFFSRTVGIILLVMFILYMALAVYQARKEGDGTQSTEEDTKNSKLWKDIVLLVIGAAIIGVGAKLLVDNGTLLAEAFGVPQSVIALTFVALGTSLPELVTAISALIKGHSDLSLGNVIGANLFNLVLVTGMASTLSPFHIPTENTLMGMNASLVVDVPVMLGVMLVLCIPTLIAGKMFKGQGVLLLLTYAAFVGFQFFA